MSAHRKLQEAHNNLMENAGSYEPMEPVPVPGAAAVASKAGVDLQTNSANNVFRALLAVNPQGTSCERPYQEAEGKALHETQDKKEISSGSSFLPDARSPAGQLKEAVDSVADATDKKENNSTQVYDQYNFQSPHGEGLEISKRIDEIIRCSETNEAIVIKGFTGCGKSTQVPQYILDHYAKKRAHCNIVVTQPRRIAAVSLAKRVCEERNWELGTIVGYQIGLDNQTSKDTRLTFCTTAVLMQRLVGARNLDSFTHVIIDEVHERDQDMDFVLLVVRKLLRTVSPSVKVILMSATINVSHFTRYFAVPVNDELVEVPVIELEQRKQHNLSICYLNELSPYDVGVIPEIRIDEPGISSRGYDVCVRIIEKFDDTEKLEGKERFGSGPNETTKKHSVLVFLPGIHEIDELYYAFKRQADKCNYKWDLVVLHSSLSKEEQAKVFHPVQPGYRKIILSTNIAESSITVVDVKYVIDFCLTKLLVFDPLTNFSCLQLTWASQSSCKQRAGRAGRVMDGIVYRLVPRAFYKRLPEDTVPEMLRAALDQTVLKAKMLKMGEPQAVLALALDPPDLSNITRTVLNLKEAGALLLTINGNLSKFDGDLTFLGRTMAFLPLDVHLTKLIMFGHMFSVLEDAVTIAACLSVRNLFYVSYKDPMADYNNKLSYADKSASDCVAYLRAYTEYKRAFDTNVFKSSMDKEKAYAKQNGLNFRALREVSSLITEILKRLSDRGIQVINQIGWNEWEKVVVLRVVIAGAFYPHYFLRGSSGGQIDEREAVRTLNSKDPFRSVYLKGLWTGQPGPLYAKTIKNALKICNANMRLSFDDATNKVYVEFERDKSTKRIIPGNVSMAVYRAVKMRQLKIPIAIPVLPAEEAQERADQLGLSYKKREFMADLGKRPVRVTTTLPGLDVSILPIEKACHVEDPNRFWVRSTCVKLKYDSIKKTLNDSGELPSLSGSVVVGKVYAARYPLRDPNADYYRVRVDQIVNDTPGNTMVQVTYIDRGSNETVAKSHLREVNPDLQREAPLAVECTLRGVQPCVAITKTGVWSNEDIDKFKMKMASGKLYGEIFSVVDGIVSLDLLVQTSDGEICINDWLIDQRFADPVDDSFRSVANHEQREKARTYLDEGSGGSEGNRVIEAGQEFEKWTVDDDVESPSSAECQKFMHLQGPFSPLETKVRGIIRSALGKDTNIERESVNSVLFDNDPTDPHERLLVASSVSVNSMGTVLTLRNTTLMPNLHGLAPLITLIFAPAVELRLNPEETRYTGCVAGLGCDPRTGLSLYPENDMEIVFDCNIDIEDMKYINNLRLCLDCAFSLREGEDVSDVTPAEMSEYQKKIMEMLNRLLERRRDSVEPCYFGQEFKWNVYKPDLLLQPDVPGEVFRMHSALATRSSEL